MTVYDWALIAVLIMGVLLYRCAIDNGRGR